MVTVLNTTHIKTNKHNNKNRTQGKSGRCWIYSGPWLWCLYMFKFITLYTLQYLQFSYINYTTIKLLKPDLLSSLFFFFTIHRTQADNSLLFCFSYKEYFFTPPLELIYKTILVEIWNISDLECTKRQKSIFGCLFSCKT